MGVTVVLHEATRTGAPRVGGLIAGALQKHEEVRVLVLRDGPLVPWIKKLVGEENVVVFEDDSFSYSVPFAQRLRDAKVVLAKDPSDLIYVNSVAASVFVAAAKSLDRKTILHVHEKTNELRNLLRIEAAKLEVVPLADGIVLAADDLLADVNEVFRTTADNTLNFGIVVDAEAMRSLATEPVRPPLNFAGKAWKKRKRLAVGMCGTASLRKGADIFVDIAAQAPEIDFIWIGGWRPPDAVDNPVCGDFESRALPNFFLTGATDNPYAYLQALSLFFLSSREDPNPLVLAETALLGVPILAFSQTTAVTDWLGRTATLCYGTPNAPDVLRVLRALDAWDLQSGLFSPPGEIATRFDLAHKSVQIREFIGSVRNRSEPAGGAQA